MNPSASWGSDGTIVFGELGTTHQLMRVPASGGTPREIPHAKATAVVSVTHIDAHRIAY